MADKIAYKILTSDQMTALQADQFAGAPIDIADGYIHLSTAAQAAETLDKHFSGQTGLWLAAVDLEALGDTVKWEISRGEQLFPHIYGPLPLSAVTAYGEVAYEADGSLRLPAAG